MTDWTLRIFGRTVASLTRDEPATQPANDPGDATTYGNQVGFVHNDIRPPEMTEDPHERIARHKEIK